MNTYINNNNNHQNSDMSTNLSMINQQQFSNLNQNSYNDNDGGSTTSSSYSSQPSPDILVHKKEDSTNSVRLMNILSDPLQQQIPNTDAHLVHGLSQHNMNLQVSPNASSQHQLTQMTIPGSQSATNILSAHFRNNLKNITSTPLNQQQLQQQQNSSIVQQQQQQQQNEANSVSPLSNNSTLHSQILTQQQHQLTQRQITHQIHQHQQQQIQQKQLLALAAQNNRPDLQAKIPFNARNTNGNNNPYNKSQFNIGSNQINSDINNLPELNPFLQWNQSNNQMPFMPQFQNSPGICDITNGFFQSSHQQMLQSNSSSSSSSNQNSFLNGSQPQIKQQPQTPVPSPLPSIQLQQQNSHNSDLLTTSHGSLSSSFTETDASSINLVSALTAAINANSTSKLKNESLLTTCLPNSANNSSNSSNVNNLTNGNASSDKHLNDTSLNESSNSPLIINTNQGDMKNKYTNGNSQHNVLPISPSSNHLGKSL